MTPLQAWTGMAGDRDPAQPLLTLLDPAGRVELSGATTANWVAKSANLLVDGLGSPARVGLLLPLHWQAVALLLAGVASGATVVVADGPEALAGCEVVFTSPQHAETCNRNRIATADGSRRIGSSIRLRRAGRGGLWTTGASRRRAVGTLL